MTSLFMQYILKCTEGQNHQNPGTVQIKIKVLIVDLDDTYIHWALPHHPMAFVCMF